MGCISRSFHAGAYSLRARSVPVGGFILFAGSGSGSTGEGTNYFSSGTGYGFAPGATIEGDIYLIPGSVVPARKLIYSLHRTLPAVDSFGPSGSLDNRTTGQTISGTAPVYGWLLEPNGKFVVNVLVDGKPFGAARYGVPRPDVRKAYPHAPLGTGFEYSLDTSDLRNGKHTITLNAVNEAGKTSSFFARVTVKNFELCGRRDGDLHQDRRVELDGGSQDDSKYRRKYEKRGGGHDRTHDAADARADDQSGSSASRPRYSSRYIVRTNPGVTEMKG